jgi:hypothetical protein
MGSSRRYDFRPIQLCGYKPHHARENLHDGRKLTGWCRRRSTAPSFIAFFADLVPGCPLKVGVQALAFESGFPETEAVTSFPLRDDPPKPFLNKGFHRGLFPVCQGAHLFKKAVWYLYGCFHMVSHIIKYGNMSSNRGCPFHFHF